MFAAFFSLVLLVVNFHPATAIRCTIGQEPDPESDYKLRWMIRVEDPCQCTEVRVGGMGTESHYRPSKATYFDTFLQSNDPSKIRNWLDCPTKRPCVNGTAQNPANLCSEIYNECDRPSSGLYFLQGNGTAREVHCEMPGGWARFGKSNMQSAWNYTYEDLKEVHLSIISEADIDVIKEFPFSDFKIHTDVEFFLQADESFNPSIVKVMYLPSLLVESLSIGSGLDHTALVFNTEGDRLLCNGGRTSRCGGDNLPPKDGSSNRLAITSAFFGPRADGAVTNNAGQWHRNRYTWSGSFYYILAK